MTLPQVKFTKFTNDEREALALNKIKFNMNEKKLSLYSSENNTIKEEIALPLITNKELYEIISFSYHPKIAETLSDMVDTSSIYLYTGNESGLFNGDWYYYDGNNWVDGGTYSDSLKIVTPEMFGAVGDGMADDTQALQDMYESGGNIFLFSKDKIYLTKGNVILSLNNSTFLGNGATIKWDSHDFNDFPYEEWAIFSTKPELAGNKYWILKDSLIFRDLNFDGNRSEQLNVSYDTQTSAYQGLVLELFGYKNVVIDHCSFYDTHANAVHTRATQNVYINNCRFEEIGEPNIMKQTTTKNCLTTHSSWSTTENMNLIDMENIIFTNNHIIHVTDAVICSRGSKNMVIENNYTDGCTTFLEYYCAYSIDNTPINCRVVNNVCLNPRNFFVYARQAEVISDIFNTLTINNNIVNGIGKNVLEKQYIWTSGSGFFNNSDATFDILEMCNNRCTFSNSIYSYENQSILPVKMNLCSNIVKFCDNDFTVPTLKQNGETIDVTLSSFINVSGASRAIFNGNNININGLTLTPLINVSDINYLEFSNNFIKTNFSNLDTIKCIINIDSGVKIVKVNDNVDNTTQVTDYLSFFRLLSVDSDMIASVNNNILTNGRNLIQGYLEHPFAALTVIGNTIPRGTKIFRVSNPATKSVVDNNLISTSTT